MIEKQFAHGTARARIYKSKPLSCLQKIVKYDLRAIVCISSRRILWHMSACDQASSRQLAHVRKSTASVGLHGLIIRSRPSGEPSEPSKRWDVDVGFCLGVKCIK